MDFTDGLKTGVLNSLTLTTAILLFLGCAEIGRPPGGEVDKTSPGIISSAPENGSVNINSDNKVFIRFSERIQKPPKGIKSVYISPRQEIEPEIKWNSNNIELIFADSFKTDQTYIITLGSAIKDLRNNPVDSNSVIAFSTGDVIDSGYVSGYVKAEDKPKSGIMVALFSPDKFDNGYLRDSTYPDYIAQTNREGFFSFRYLPLTELSLICFDDLNRDELVALGKEAFAVPDRALDLNLNHVRDNLKLYLTSEDTTSPEIISASITSDNLLRISLSKQIDLEHFHEVSISFHSDSSGQTISSCIFRESDLLVSDQFNFVVDQIPTGYYRPTLQYSTDKSLTFKDSILIEKKDDKIKPAIISFSPDSLPVYLGSFKSSIRFSEPIDSAKVTEATFTLWENDSTFYPMLIDQVKPFSVSFKNDSLHEGGKYKIRISEFEIYDLAGNNLGDSLTEYSFKILDTDSLGSVSGKVLIETKDEELALTALIFTNIKSKQQHSLFTDSPTFNINLPAGKYLMSGFIDSNNNNEHDKGSLLPYGYSETYKISSDTITVRSRFETTGIEFKFE